MKKFVWLMLHVIGLEVLDDEAIFPGIACRQERWQRTEKRKPLQGNEETIETKPLESDLVFSYL